MKKRKSISGLIERAFRINGALERLTFQKSTGVVMFDVPNGVVRLYPDGTRHFIRDSWYSDINTDQL